MQNKSHRCATVLGRHALNQKLLGAGQDGIEFIRGLQLDVDDEALAGSPLRSRREMDQNSKRCPEQGSKEYAAAVR